MVVRRKSLGMTQALLAEKSGVSPASIKRFERLHRISLESLVAIAFALRCEDDFEGLFASRTYASIDDVVQSARREGRGATRR